MPSFSIVIPTRNRSDLLAFAVESAVAQDTDDYEVIVSDNSTASEHVENAGKLCARRDVRYVRPSAPLTMPDHWEFATRHATKDYLLILTDRMVMRPGTLRILSELIVAAPAGAPSIIMWSGNAGFLQEGCFVESPYLSQARLRSSRDVLAEYAANRQWRSNLIGLNNLPRGLNSAVSTKLVDEIRGRRGRLYEPLSPDYTSAFLQLAFAPDQLELDLPLYAAHGTRSNGHQTLIRGIATYADQFAVPPFERCPLDIDTVMNSTYRDYLFVATEAGQLFPAINLSDYLLVNWRELQLKQQYGSRLDLRAMRRKVLEKAAALPEVERRAFERGREEIDATDTWRWRLRNRLARGRALSALKTAATAIDPRRRTSRYQDVLTAVAANPLRWSGAEAALRAGAEAAPRDAFGASR